MTRAAVSRSADFAEPYPADFTGPHPAVFAEPYPADFPPDAVASHPTQHDLTGVEPTRIQVTRAPGWIIRSVPRLT
jgi:hypothetical protein